MPLEWTLVDVHQVHCVHNVHSVHKLIRAAELNPQTVPIGIPFPSVSCLPLIHP
jgi:hypothetical protein